MKNIFFLFGFLFFSATLFAQFQPSEEGLIIMVSDGTDKGRNSELTQKGNVPTSYDYNGKKIEKGASASGFSDPIRALGMTDCIQAAAFLDRPEYGIAGFFLIFSVNDAIGGKQGTHIVDGKTHFGVYRLIRQKKHIDEEVPKGMTPYRIRGTFFILGIS